LKNQFLNGPRRRSLSKRSVFAAAQLKCAHGQLRFLTGSDPGPEGAFLEASRISTESACDR